MPKSSLEEVRLWIDICSSNNNDLMSQAVDSVYDLEDE